MTQFYPQFEAHLADKNTLSLYDAQHLMMDHDNLAEVKELFTKFAYGKKGLASKHFLVTNYDDCSSMVVTEQDLQEMLNAGKVDDACLVYVVKNTDDAHVQLPLSAAASHAQPYLESVEFMHAPQVFHQNMLTKNLSSKQVGQSAPPSTLNSSMSSMATTAKGAKSAVTQPTIKKTIPSAKASQISTKANTQSSSNQQSKLQTVPKSSFDLGNSKPAKKPVDPQEMDEDVSMAAATPQNEIAADSEEIPAAKKAQAAAALNDDEDVEMMPVRRRANKKRRVQRDSSIDEDEDGLDVKMQTTSAAAAEANEGLKTPPKSNSVLTAIDDHSNKLRLSEEQTAITPTKPPHAAAPGKKWAKVKKTEQTMDAKGYMCFQDVEVWEEVDDVKPAKRAPAAKSAAAKSGQSAGQKQAAGAKSQKSGGPKVQSALGSFFKAK